VPPVFAHGFQTLTEGRYRLGAASGASIRAIMAFRFLGGDAGLPAADRLTPRRLPLD